jgi:HK97 family phage portal protein
MKTPLRSRFVDWLSGGEISRLRSYMLGSQNTFSNFFGGANDEFSPPEYGNYLATSNPVYTMVTMRAAMLASLPLALYRARGIERDLVTRGRLFDLLSFVNPFWTFNRLMRMTVYSLDLWGQSFWFLERGESGKAPPKEIWWARPDRVKVVTHPTEYISGFLYTPPNGDNPISYTPDEVVWIPNPNPIDEFQGLAPLAPARLAADLSSAMMSANRRIFEQGYMQAGFVFPPDELTQWTADQAKELEDNLQYRFSGQKRAHRLAVMRTLFKLEQTNLTPEDAQYLEGLKWNLEEVCRAYHWPLDLVGGQRTFENFDAAMKAAWTNAVIPLGEFVANELEEKLLPMFGKEADQAEFDSSKVEVLQEAETEAWERAQGMIERGALLINEWREGKGLPPVSWGNTWWRQSTLVPADEIAPEPEEESEDTDTERGVPQNDLLKLLLPENTRQIAFGSDEHSRLWRAFVRRTEAQEKKFAAMTVDLLKRQLAAVLARLRQRSAKDVVEDPFNKSEWVKRFRQAARPVLAEILQESGNAALADLELDIEFDTSAPAVVRFLERRAQRFAREVNDTTWEALKVSLSEGIEAGEGIADLEDRIEAVMGERIASTPETIARTEVIGAANGAVLEAWEQSGVVEGKSWLAALDDRTRESHIAAHGQTVPLDEDFQVGVGSGPAPGQIGEAEEDISCRCTITAVVSERLVQASANGYNAKVRVTL